MANLPVLIDKVRWFTLVIGTALSLSGCASAGFERPDFTYSQSSGQAGGPMVNSGQTKPHDVQDQTQHQQDQPDNDGVQIISDVKPLDVSDPEQVLAYLRAHERTFDKLIKSAETAKNLTELPIIGAAAFAPTWLALGKGSHPAIIAAGGAGGLGALSQHISPRERATNAALASSAVSCVKREYSTLLTNAAGLSALTDNKFQPDKNNVTTLVSPMRTYFPGLSQEVATAGIVATIAAEEVTTKLKLKLANLGQTPDYGAIAASIAAKLEAGKAQLNQNGQVSLLDSNPNKEAIIALAKLISEYSANVAICVAKMP